MLKIKNSQIGQRLSDEGHFNPVSEEPIPIELNNVDLKEAGELASANGKNGTVSALVKNAAAATNGNGHQANTAVVAAAAAAAASAANHHDSHDDHENVRVCKNNLIFLSFLILKTRPDLDLTKTCAIT